MRAIIAGLALLLAAAGAAAAPEGNSARQDGERFGMLLASTIVARTLVFGMIDDCTARFAPLEIAGLDAKMEWEARNAPWEAKAGKLADKMTRKLEFLGPAGLAELRESVLNMARVSSERMSKTIVANLMEKVPEERRQQACGEMLKGIQAGRMDFEVAQKSAYDLIQSDR